MSRLLINQRPLVVLPELAKAIGLNNAIVIQQIHYWIEQKREAGSDHHFIDGRWWTYNTVSEWAEQFPFWSESTVKRTLANLRDRGLVLAEQHGGDWDKTLWYTICYERLDQIDPIDQVTPAIIDQVNLTHSTYSTKTNNTESNTERGRAAPQTPQQQLRRTMSQVGLSDLVWPLAYALQERCEPVTDANLIENAEKLFGYDATPDEVADLCNGYWSQRGRGELPYPSQVVTHLHRYRKWVAEGKPAAPAAKPAAQSRAERHKQATLSAFEQFLGVAHD